MKGLSCSKSLAATVIFILLAGKASGQSGEGATISAKGDSTGFRLGHQLAPVVLISGGLLVESLDIKKDVQAWFPRTHTGIDDYTQYAPAVILFASDVLGAEHRNSVWNQTKYLVISELATSFITHSLKRITHVTRPDNSDQLSFPSGHTSQAFTLATVLYNETRDFNMPLALSGYLFSTATGTLRITNNRHWISDVLVGAGIGILVTNIVYYFEPLKNWDPFRMNNRAMLIPDINFETGTYMLSLNIML